MRAAMFPCEFGGSLVVVEDLHPYLSRSAALAGAFRFNARGADEVL